MGGEVRKLGEGGERNMEEERGRGIREEYEKRNLGENHGWNVHGICMEYA